MIFLSYICIYFKLITKQMKKLLLSACAIVVAVATFSQSRMIEMPNQSLTKGYSTSSIIPNFIPSTASVAPAPIWEDDCSSASTWVFTNTSTQNFDWEIEMNPGATPAGGALTPMASYSIKWIYDD